MRRGGTLYLLIDENASLGRHLLTDHSVWNNAEVRLFICLYGLNESWRVTLEIGVAFGVGGRES